MKKSFLLVAAVMATITSQATLYTTNWSNGFINGQVVPDNDISGWTDTRTVDTLPAGSFVGLSVDINLTGGWNGDLYAYLVNDTGFSVLLDRVGIGESGVGVYGYGDSGMNVTLTASGTSIHQYGGGSTISSPPTGTWRADTTSGSIASFLPGSPNGTWSLFIADLSAGGVTTVANWGLQMDIVAVPEVETWVAAAIVGMFGAFWLNRQIWSGVKPPQKRR